MIASNTIDTTGSTGKPVDGIVCSALNGPGRIAGLEGDPVPLSGPGRVEVVDNTVLGTPATLNRGIRSNSGVVVRGNRIVGANATGILFRNDVSFGQEHLRHVMASGNAVRTSGVGIALEEFTGGKRLQGDCVARLDDNLLELEGGGGPSPAIAVQIAPAFTRAVIDLELHRNEIAGTVLTGEGLVLHGNKESRLALSSNRFRDLDSIGTMRGGAQVIVADNEVRRCSQGLTISDTAGRRSGDARLLIESEGIARDVDPCGTTNDRTVRIHDNVAEELGTPWLASIVGCGTVEATRNQVRTQSSR